MAHVLLLGPDRVRAAGIRSLLRTDGHRVSWLRSTDGWRARERELLPDVVVALVTGPDPLGTTTRQPCGFPAPLLLIHHEADLLGELFLEERLIDHLATPFMSEELLSRVDALVRVRRVIQRGAAHEGPAVDADRGGLRAIGRRLTSWVGLRLPQDEKPVGPYLEVASRVAGWADRRDAFEPGHAERVTSFCGMVADVLAFEESECSALLRAAMLHDIGKVAVPVEVLRQREPLAESQLRLIRTHPARGAALLRALDPDEQVARVVLCHHERPDGAGYYGFQGDAVPRAARVLAVAEAFDAMTSSRIREPLSRKAALDLLQSSKGRAYDATAVDALAEALHARTIDHAAVPAGRW